MFFSLVDGCLHVFLPFHDEVALLVQVILAAKSAVTGHEDFLFQLPQGLQDH
jgi:hypothetical protein